MDILGCSQFSRKYKYDKTTGEDISLEQLSPPDYDDPLTVLLNHEEIALREKDYASFSELSDQVRYSINNAL